MGKLSEFGFTGKIGGLVYSRVGDSTIVRSAPQNIRQTEATKKRAGEFGRASKAGKSLRMQLKPVILFPSDNKMQTRLVSTLLLWLRKSYSPGTPCTEVPFISRFQFIEGHTIRERWNIVLGVSNPDSGLIELKIPAFVPRKKMNAPAGTISAKCDIGVASFHVESGMPGDGNSVSIYYDYDDEEVPERIVSLPVTTTPGSLVVTAICLQFLLPSMMDLEQMKKKGFISSEVVSSMYF
jgi:hypothetical protein